jgi:hypothetical protein
MRAMSIYTVPGGPLIGVKVAAGSGCQGLLPAEQWMQLDLVYWHP